MDPIATYRDVATPFAWYGVRPELFDAPARDPRADMDWEAHSFLCISPDAVLTRQVQAIAGFSWGFTITGHDIRLTQPATLDGHAWDSHPDVLMTGYPQWAFDPGSQAEVDELLRHVERVGGTLTAPAHMRPVGVYSGYFTDPDGHLLEIAWNSSE